MAATIGRLAFVVSASVGKFNRSMSSVGKRIAKLRNSGGIRFLRGFASSAISSTAALTGLGTAIGGVAAGIAAMKRGMAFEEVQRSFASLAESIGTTADAMLGKLRKATRGAVSDYDLMLSANNAMLLGVAKSDDQFAELASKAVVLGQALGRTPVEALNDITVGIGRQSRMILDNLGIVVKADEAYAVYAASIGKSAAALTDAERKQAFFSATLDAVNAKVATLPSNVESSKVAFDRLGSSIINIIDHAMLPVVQAATPFVNELAAKIEGIPLGPFIAKVFKAFSLVAKGIAIAVDNSGALLFALGAVLVVTGAIGGLMAFIAWLVVGIAHVVSKLLGGEGFAQQLEAIEGLYNASSQVGEIGLEMIADSTEFFGGTAAQGFTDRLLQGMDESLGEALYGGATARQQADTVSAGVLDGLGVVVQPTEELNSSTQDSDRRRAAAEREAQLERERTNQILERIERGQGDAALVLQ